MATLQSTAPAESAHTPIRARLEWIDVAKGVAITLVVLGHVVWVLSLMELPTSDVWRRILEATGPMRMPGFFLMSGLFAHRFATGSFERFARRRIIGFAYLFVVWIAITSVVEVGLKLWLGPTADTVSRTKFFDHVLQLETPLWYLIALPAFHLLWWVTRSTATWITLLATGIAYLLVDTGAVTLTGTLGSTGFRGMIQYAFFFMVGARLSHTLREAVGRMTATMSATIVTTWLVMEILLPTMPLKSLLAVPALFAISQLLVLTPLKEPAQRAGRRTLPLYLLHWLLISIGGGVWLTLDLPFNAATDLLVPGITLPVVVALITLVWRLTRNLDVLWGPPHALENWIIDAARSVAGHLPTTTVGVLDAEPQPGFPSRHPAARLINTTAAHARLSLTIMNS